MQWVFSREQKYLAAVSQLMDYVQGLNPLGRCYASGIGADPVRHPHDRESVYAQAQGWGPRPGLLVYGGPHTSGVVRQLPPLNLMPRERRYVDHLGSFAMNEFTVYQTLVFPAAIYPVLGPYRAELTACRAAHGGAREVPDVKFFLFGMGARTKLLYRDGILFDARSGKELHRWKVRKEIIVPPDYMVSLESEDGGGVTLREDFEAVWMEQGGQRTAVEGTKAPVKLPDFAGKKFPRVLRVLHQELLVNNVEAGPVPNFFIYEKPWYHDGAMVALALNETGNLGLREPFDRNNKGETEADNLGQALFLVSLVADKNHPLVAKVLAEVPRFEKTDATGKYILGRSDFSDHPVYQTKWLKYGLRALGLPDPYTNPKQKDGYSALFWMDYKDAYVPGDSNDRGNYPYLGWACDHFHGERKSPISNRDYPLAWEAKASEANYPGTRLVAEEYVKQKVSAPHTWHAAEIFLYLLEMKK